jgi:ribonuclease VapC
MTKPALVLDSFALLAYLNGEAGQARVVEALTQAEAGEVRALLCSLSLGEILYIIERRRGLVNAQRAQALLESLPLEEILPDRALIFDAAHIKAGHAISYADAFVAALAMRESAVILTGDPEFEAVQELVQIEWLRPPATEQQP